MSDQLPTNAVTRQRLERTLLSTWAAFCGPGDPPPGWLSHTTAAIADACTPCGHNGDSGGEAAVPPTSSAHADLHLLRRRIRELLAGTVLHDKLSVEDANDILNAVDLPPLPRRWRIRIGLRAHLTVTATNQAAAYETAQDTITDALRTQRVLDIDWSGRDDEAEPGELDPRLI